MQFPMKIPLTELQFYHLRFAPFKIEFFFSVCQTKFIIKCTFIYVSLSSKCGTNEPAKIKCFLICMTEITYIDHNIIMISYYSWCVVFFLCVDRPKLFMRGQNAPFLPYHTNVMLSKCQRSAYNRN